MPEIVRTTVPARSYVGIRRSVPVTELPAAWQRRLQDIPLDRDRRSDEGIERVDPFAVVGGGPVLAILEAPGVASRVTIASSRSRRRLGSSWRRVSQRVSRSSVDRGRSCSIASRASSSNEP